jgi:hypothetical protein
LDREQIFFFFPPTPGLGPQRATQRTENKHVVVGATDFFGEKGFGIHCGWSTFFLGALHENQLRSGRNCRAQGRHGGHDRPLVCLFVCFFNTPF